MTTPPIPPIPPALQPTGVYAGLQPVDPAKPAPRPVEPGPTIVSAPPGHLDVEAGVTTSEFRYGVTPANIASAVVLLFGLVNPGHALDGGQQAAVFAGTTAAFTLVNSVYAVARSLRKRHT